jgi:Tol biopolymer transport system component
MFASGSFFDCERRVEFPASTVTQSPTQSLATVRSSLETVAIDSGNFRTVYRTDELIEAPNWSSDGRSLYFNGGGHLYRLSLDSATAVPEQINTGTLHRLNNDHGISPDGTQLAISDGTKPGGSRIYLLPIGGGTPREITPLAPSYWHGWSPDGTTLVYCANRGDYFGVYSIPAVGGEEKRLTQAAKPDGLDDGPEYSPDGQWIYFNSDRTGRMQIWRMKPDGSEPEQVTKDNFNNWFAHPSPDGHWLAYLSFAPEVKGHPPDKDVMIRLLPTAGDAEPRELVKLFGGQGTINVPSWSPDSLRLAYVRYQPVVK